MNDMTQGSPAGHILRFSVPMLLGSVLQQLYNVTDAILVGRLIGKNALAAVGASFPILFLAVALIMGLTMGSTVLISQAYGAKNLDRVRLAIDTNYVFLALASLVLTGIGQIGCRAVLELVKTPPEILPDAEIFLRVTFAGLPALFGYNAISAVLRGLGDSKTPLYFLIFSTFLNALLVVVFIALLGWGIAGSALATVLAQGCSFVGGLIYLHRTHPLLRLELRRIRFDRGIMKKSVAIGLPTGIQQMLVGGGMMALMSIVNGFGTDVIAAYTAAGRLDTFASMPAISLSAAASTFVGQNIGAKKYDRVGQGFKATMTIAAVISLSLSAVVLCLPDSLMSLFSSDPHVIAAGREYLLIAAGFYVAFAFMFVVNGVLRGAGDTVIPMLITLLALWGIRLPTAYFLSRAWGTSGIWWGVPAGWVVGFVLATTYYLTGNWRKKAERSGPGRGRA